MASGLFGLDRDQSLPGNSHPLVVSGGTHHSGCYVLVVDDRVGMDCFLKGPD